ncbi:hypothetical protein JMJ77_0003050 [Colletotrichum scovillei]|uniref:Uncharacterized protein n=1 Tax=Colletotrichum scovillei TaxID=1209932 RepID=A0A9P7U9S9_9PEZI|nr:hypothetical protein JMJ78_0006264 [Colletotrichum scovillei]KAG7043344.1 hypothetical protein JMJ77_0003050 [Colletotrichum scovillei]KAG7062791.1 hypothetical protein JMJ76_0009634 [Colletotrichum scovillei]
MDVRRRPDFSFGGVDRMRVEEGRGAHTLKNGLAYLVDSQLGDTEKIGSESAVKRSHID